MEAIFTKGVEVINISGLMQWDVGQEVKISFPSMPATFQVHFGHKKAKEAYAVEAITQNGSAMVQIPNILLQQSQDIIAWVYVSSGMCCETTHIINFDVEARPRPSDYAYKETDILNYATVVEKSQEIAAIAARAEVAEACNETLASAKSYTDTEIADLVNAAPSELDTLKELADAMIEHEDVVEALNSAIGTKANQTDLTAHTNNADIHVTANDKTNWNNKVQRISLQGQLQKDDYRRSVIALCKVSNYGVEINSYSFGRLIFHRTNGLMRHDVFADLYISGQFNYTNTINASILEHGFADYIRMKPCTFTYKGVKYGGVEVYINASYCSYVVFEGDTNFSIFGLDYCTTDNTIIDEEVYNSLKYDTVSYNDTLRYNTKKVYTEGDIVSLKTIDVDASYFYNMSTQEMGNIYYDADNKKAHVYISDSFFTTYGIDASKILGFAFKAVSSTGNSAIETQSNSKNFAWNPFNSLIQNNTGNFYSWIMEVDKSGVSSDVSTSYTPRNFKMLYMA